MIVIFFSLIVFSLKGPVNQYIARVFLENRGVRNFSWKFAVIKDLVALTTVRVLVRVDNIYHNLSHSM